MDEEYLYNTMLSECPDVLNVDELCKVLGIGKKLAYNILQENQVPHLKIGRAYKIPKISLIRYLINQQN